MNKIDLNPISGIFLGTLFTYNMRGVNFVMLLQIVILREKLPKIILKSLPPW